MTRDGKADAVLIDNTVKEGETLVQVIAPEGRGVPLDAEISTTEQPGIITCSACLGNKRITPQISGGESRIIESDEEQAYEKEFVIDKKVDLVFEKGSYLFRVSWCGYAPGDDT